MVVRPAGQGCRTRLVAVGTASWPGVQDQTVVVQPAGQGCRTRLCDENMRVSAPSGPGSKAAIPMAMAAARSRPRLPSLSPSVCSAVCERWRHGELPACEHFSPVSSNTAVIARHGWREFTQNRTSDVEIPLCSGKALRVALLQEWWQLIL